jgi:hypothetical protein
MFLSKKGASIVLDDYESTELFDQCDPWVGFPGYPEKPHFDWVDYFEEK